MARRSSIGWLLGLVLAVLPQLALATAGRGVVVCQEVGGAAALEWALAGCCDSATAPTADVGPSGWRAEPDACRACLDTPLGASALRDDVARGGLAATVGLTLHLPLPLGALALRPLAVGASAGAVGPPLHPPLVVTRPRVLRC